MSEVERKAKKKHVPLNSVYITLKFPSKEVLDMFLEDMNANIRLGELSSLAVWYGGKCEVESHT